MEQKGRDDYVREIRELKAKAAELESELATYDAIYKRIYEALPKVESGRETSVKTAVNRAMADAYIQWQSGEKV